MIGAVHTMIIRLEAVIDLGRDFIQPVMPLDDQ